MKIIANGRKRPIKNKAIKNKEEIYHPINKKQGMTLDIFKKWGCKCTG